MQRTLNILVSFSLLLALVTFSSFKSAVELPVIKKEQKQDKKEEEGEKESQLSVSFEATFSPSVVLEPVDFVGVFHETFTAIRENEWFEFDFELKSQDYYRIFFTHIISKNAP